MNTIHKEEAALASFCLQAALRHGAQKARITLNKSCMDLIGTLNGEVDKVSHCLDRSITASLFVDGRFGSYSINRLEESVLDDFIAEAVQQTRMLAVDECRDLPDPERTEKNATDGKELGLFDEGCGQMTPEKRLELALDASIFKKYTASTDWKLISEEAEYSDCTFDTLVLDSQGTHCRHTETSFEYGVEMTVEDSEGGKFSGYWWDATPMLTDLGIATCCETALRRAVAQIGPKPRRSGRYKMVVDSECASRLVTPMLNALSGYSLQQKNSFLNDALGRKVFSEGLTIMDNCRVKGQTGSRLFDSEGVQTKMVPIIDKGVVSEYFINTYMSAKMGMAPTIEDATRPKLMPWPVAGLDTAAIMRRCRNGILVTGFNGGNSNSSTGDYSFGIEGFAFKDGRITHPVREMLITGNFIDLWNHLVAVGDNARLCMSKLIPTIAFEDVDFSG